MLAGRVSISLPMSMSVAVAVVHEQVHYRAQQQQEVWECAQQMRTVLGPQKETCYSEKDAQDDTGARAPWEEASGTHCFPILGEFPVGLGFKFFQAKGIENYRYRTQAHRRCGDHWTK